MEYYNQPDMVLVNKDILNAFMLTSNLTVKDLKKLGLLKKADETKNKFKLDPKKGEGRPSKLEMEYTNKLKDLYKPVDEVIKKLKDNELTDAIFITEFNNCIDDYIKEAQNIVCEYIPKIYEGMKEVGLNKLKELDIEPSNNENPEILEALVVWQKNAVEKHAEILRQNVTDKIYGKNYFVTTYAKP